MMPWNHTSRGGAICLSMTAIAQSGAWTDYLMKFTERSYMQNAKVLSQKEVKAIIAEHFGIPETKVAVLKYSYMIITDDDEEKKEDK